MPRCVASFHGCLSGKPGTAYVQMFGFPKDPERLNLWLEQLNRGAHWKPSPTSLLCVLHFDSEQFEKVSLDSKGVKKDKKTLVKNAIPTVFGKKSPGKINSQCVNSVICAKKLEAVAAIFAIKNYIRKTVPHPFSVRCQSCLTHENGTQPDQTFDSCTTV